MSGSSRQSGSKKIEVRALYNSRFDDLSPLQQEELREKLDRSPLEAECYWFVQLMYTVYDNRLLAPEQAKEVVRASWGKLSEDARQAFGEFETFLSEYSDALFAYWRRRLTNGRSESNNRTIRDIQRVGRGLGVEETQRRAVFGASPTRRMKLAKLGLPGPLERFKEAGGASPPVTPVVKLRHGLHKRGKRPRKDLTQQLKLFDE